MPVLHSTANTKKQLKTSSMLTSTIMKRSLNDKSALKGSTNDDDKKNNAANDSKKPKLTISNDPVCTTTKKTYVKKRKAAGTNNPKLTIKKTSQKQMKSAAAKAVAATVAAATSNAAATGVLPTSISPASLIAKPAKSSAGSGQVRSIAPASLTKVASLPSPPSSASSPQLSGVGSGLEDAEPIDLFVPLVSAASMSTPPLDDWATQTADEILAASTADDFFWLSNNDSSDDSITTSAATGDKNGSTSTSLSLSFDSADVDMDSMAEIDFDDVYCFDNDEASDAKYSKQPAADAFEPFCDFDFSLDPPATAATEGEDVYSSTSAVSATVSATAIGAGASADPYGFLDLGITI